MSDEIEKVEKYKISFYLASGIIERLLLPYLLLFLQGKEMEEETNGNNSIHTSNNIFYNINNVNLLLIIVIKNLRISFPNNYH